MAKKPEKDYPSTHFIRSLFNSGYTTKAAVSEWIDNSITDAGATHFQLEVHNNHVSAFDNGRGLSDLGLITGLGHSKSKDNPKAIGYFGTGSKYAQTHFGSTVTVYSVCEGKFYKNRVDYQKILESGEWPDRYQADPLPVQQAPKFIHGGGTIIVVSGRDLIPKRPTINFPNLQRALSLRYRPALQRGVVIKLVDCRKSKRGQFYELDPDLSALGSGKLKLTEQSGSVDIEGFAPLGFKLRYGRLEEHDPMLNGIHYAFGDRMVTKTDNITDEVASPSQLYAEVILGEEWKACLNPKKDEIVFFFDDLRKAVYDLLKDWVAKLKKEAEEIRISGINFSLSKALEEVLIFDDSRPGPYVRGLKVVTTSRVGPGPHPDPRPNVENDEAVVPPEGVVGIGDAGKRHMRPSGIKVECDPRLGHRVSKHDFVERPARIIITLNSSIPTIDHAYHHSKNMVEVWPYLAHELAEFARNKRADIDKILPHLMRALERNGYSPNWEDETEVYEAVRHYVTMKCPANIGKAAIAAVA